MLFYYLIKQLVCKHHSFCIIDHVILSTIHSSGFMLLPDSNCFVHLFMSNCNLFILKVSLVISFLFILLESRAT